MKNWFEKNQPLLQAFSLFAPSRFPQLVKNFKTAHDLQACFNTFCKMHNIGAFRCADELFNFARFEKFDCSSVCQQEDDDDDSGQDDDYDDDDDDDDDDCYRDVDDDDDEVSSTSDNEQSDNGAKEAKKQSKKKFHLSLTLFYSFVTHIRLWLMCILKNLSTFQYTFTYTVNIIQKDFYSNCPSYFLNYFKEIQTNCM